MEIEEHTSESELKLTVAEVGYTEIEEEPVCPRCGWLLVIEDEYNFKCPNCGYDGLEIF
jgi:tRNA(Ile2) C34 agmatinyltransferase TiaS